MVGMREFHKDLDEEIGAILASDFNIDVTKTTHVPHADDQAITFPNIDAKTQGTKFLETTVLYVDMRRSTELNMKHRAKTVARLYSAFVRAMTRCAHQFGGEVRGIIGDRVMILFDSVNCFVSAVDTAILINSVCEYVVNKHFANNQVTFGIGIDYGPMLAAKTGIRRHGSAQQSYRSLVWLGRPANIASKLTDQANKPAEQFSLTRVRVALSNGLGGFTYQVESPHEFAEKFWHNPVTGLMTYPDTRFHSFTTFKESVETRPATPPILVSKAVYDGLKAATPKTPEIEKGWFSQQGITIPEYDGEIYGGNVIFSIFANNGAMS
jgi:adenylate cyclase